MPTSIWLDNITWSIIVFAANGAGVLVLYFLYKYLTVPSLMPQWLRQLLGKHRRRQS